MFLLEEVSYYYIPGEGDSEIRKRKGVREKTRDCNGRPASRPLAATTRTVDLKRDGDDDVVEGGIGRSPHRDEDGEVKTAVDEVVDREDGEEGADDRAADEVELRTRRGMRGREGWGDGEWVGEGDGEGKGRGRWRGKGGESQWSSNRYIYNN